VDPCWWRRVRERCAPVPALVANAVDQDLKRRIRPGPHASALVLVRAMQRGCQQRSFAFASQRRCSSASNKLPQPRSTLRCSTPVVAQRRRAAPGAASSRPDEPAAAAPPEDLMIGSPCRMLSSQPDAVDQSTRRISTGGEADDSQRYLISVPHGCDADVGGSEVKSRMSASQTDLKACPSSSPRAEYVRF
jgi:hypothetical protein